MIKRENNRLVISSPGDAGKTVSWDTVLGDRTLNLGVEIAPREGAEAEALDDKVHSLSTEEMGIAQRTEALSQEIQKAIMSGDTARAQDLMAQLSAPGSFYQQEWEAGHRILWPSARPWVERVVAGLREAAALWDLGAGQVATLAIAWIQHLPYGGPFGICHPGAVLSRGEGACGARVYFLYLILKTLGHDCLIWGSQDYNHFMVGVAGAPGKSKAWDGRKYAFLETTEPGWKPGQIPPDRGDLDSWEGFALGV